MQGLTNGQAYCGELNLAEVTLTLNNWRFVEVEFGFLSMQPEDSAKDVLEKLRKEDKDRFAQELQKQRDTLREKVRNELKSHPDIGEVGDLFNKSEAEKPIIKFSQRNAAFPPLLAILHLPVRLQTIEKELLILGVPSERFVIIFDGSLLLIGIPSSKAEHMLGFADARDRILELVGNAEKFKTIAPCVSRSSLLVVNGRAGSVKVPEYFTPYKLMRNVSLKEAAKIVYLRLAGILSSYYHVCEDAQEAVLISTKISSEEGQILQLVKDFLSTRFYQVLKRHSIGKTVRARMTVILELLAEHGLLSAGLSEDRPSFESILHEDRLLNDFLTRADWKDFTEPGTVDSETALAVIDHVQSETQTSEMISVTIWAGVVGAITGAVVGSLFTLVISRLI